MPCRKEIMSGFCNLAKRFMEKYDVDGTVLDYHVTLSMQQMFMAIEK